MNSSKKAKYYPLMFDTPVQFLERTSFQLGIEVRIKLDQYLPLFGGGSKARKIVPILYKLLSSDHNAIVTAGSSSSNHARVVALACAQLGLKCKLIIHDSPNYSMANLQVMRMAGADLTFCDISEVAEKMDLAMQQFFNMGLRPFYIWGGGHAVEGTYAYYLALQEFNTQAKAWIPDFIIVPSGTGGTQAGLHLGAEIFYPDCKVYGISVSRSREKGKLSVEKSVSELKTHLCLNTIRNEVFFYDDWVGDGYGKNNAAVSKVIDYLVKTEGILVDPVYTGKAFLSIFDLVKQNKIPIGSRVLFWHTGSFFNLFSVKE